MAAKQTPKRPAKAAPPAPARPGVREVPFVVKALQAREVAVSGDFTGWSDRIRLTPANGDGEWRATLQLPPGEYQYRLIVDGEWRDHPDAPKRVPNPFGSENCVLTVP